MATKKTKKKAAKRRTKAPPPAPLTRGCVLGHEQCQARRIHDWKRARYDALKLLKAGTLVLCDEHRAKLEKGN